MKRKLFFLLFFIPILFNSCLNDAGDYENLYLEMGVLHGFSPTTLIIKTDSDQLLKPVSVANNVKLDIENGTRVIVQYSIVEEIKSTNVDYTVKIHDIGEVLTKPILHVTNQQIRDTLSNDPVQIYNVWIAQHFLNVEFSFSGGQKKHYFYLSLDPQAQLVGGKPIILNFHHNDKDDVSYTTYRGVMSIPISELQDENVTKVNLRFIAKDKYSNPYTKDIEYKYGE